MVTPKWRDPAIGRGVRTIYCTETVSRCEICPPEITRHRLY
jgi:hypothetical protein